MDRAVIMRQPLWAGECQAIETAMLRETEGAEYRESEGADNNPKGLKVGGADAPDGADPMGLKNNQNFKG